MATLFIFPFFLLGNFNYFVGDGIATKTAIEYGRVLGDDLAISG